MQFPILQDFADLLKCPQCNATIAPGNISALFCPACQHLYVLAHDIPILVRHARPSPGPPPDHDFQQKMARVYGLPETPAVLERIRDLFAQTWSFSDPSLDGENGRFLNRVRSSGCDIGDWNAGALSQPDQDARSPALTQQIPQLRWLLDYLPPALSPGRRDCWNVRFENSGSVPVHANGAEAVFLSYSLADESHHVTYAEIATPLPVDLEPGRTIAVPLYLQTPLEPGRYLLNLGYLSRGQFTCFQQHCLHVSAGIPPDPPAWNYRNLQLDYEHDHLSAIQLGIERVKQLGVTLPRILEIGGNASPMIRDFPGDLFNVDIDVHGTQMGLLANRLYGGSMKFMVADANALPFADGTFDAIIIFSSLHHLPDPRASLRHFSRKLAPHGIIGIFCEPIATYFGTNIDSALLDELKNGANEQAFTLDEWAGIFRDAGLREEQIVVDAGSLKAFLRLSADTA